MEKVRYAVIPRFTVKKKGKLSTKMKSNNNSRTGLSNTPRRDMLSVVVQLSVLF
jgi:hypothetical protein